MFAGAPARRRADTGSHPSTGGIPRTDICATATATGSCASSQEAARFWITVLQISPRGPAMKSPLDQSRLPRGPGPERNASTRPRELVAEEFLGGPQIEHELRSPALVLVQEVSRKVPPLEVREAEGARSDTDTDLGALGIPALRIRRGPRGMAAGGVEEAPELLAKGVVAGRRIRLRTASNAPSRSEATARGRGERSYPAAGPRAPATTDAGCARSLGSIRQRSNAITRRWGIPPGGRYPHVPP